MRKCPICKQKYEPKYKSTEPCPNYNCRLALADKIIPKAKKQVRKQKFEELKEKVKTLTDYENEAKKSFQKYIRLRDAELPCISCGIGSTDLWDGGHYKKVELYSGVIFHEQNCHKQCRKCNRYLGGNELNYRKGLIERIGLEAVELLEDLANELRTYKFSKDELRDIKILYNKKIKQFKQ